MTARLKHAAIWFLDWVVDRYVVQHRSQRFCRWIADHPWWGGSGRRRVYRWGDAVRRWYEWDVTPGLTPP